MTIIDFLEARIAEDEAAALVHRVGAASLTADWHTETHYGEVLIIDAYGVVVVSKAGRMSQHIARHDPARVLRECEAKRAIVEQQKIYDDAGYPDYEGGYSSAMDVAVAKLAAAYADHPDYREEWRA